MKIPRLPDDPLGTSRTCVVVDVSERSIAVTYVHLHSGNKTTLISSSRKSFSDEAKDQKFTPALLHTLLQPARGAAEKEYEQVTGIKPKVAEVLVVVAPTLANSKTLQLRESFDKDKRITDSMIQALAKKGVGDIEASSTGALLEANVTLLELNGYPTRNPAGAYAHDIKINLLASEIATDVLSALKSAIQSEFPSNSVRFRSYTRALLYLAREYGRMTRDSCVLDIGEDISTILVIRKHQIEAQEFVQLGSRELIASILPHALPQETVALVGMVEEGKANAATNESVQSGYHAAEEKLIHTFGDAFSRLSATRRVPNRFVLLCNESLAPWLATFFSRLDFAQFTVTMCPFMVRSLSDEFLTQRIDRTHAPESDIHRDMCVVLAHLEASEM